jgi:hypothetical protein
LGIGGGDTNIFAYVHNDPVNRIDPLGFGGSAGGSPNLGTTLDVVRTQKRGHNANDEDFAPPNAPSASGTVPIVLGLRESLIEAIGRLSPAAVKLTPYLNDGALLDLLARLEAQRAATLSMEVVLGTATGTAIFILLANPSTIACGAGEACAP